MTLKKHLLRLVDNIPLLEKLREYWAIRRAVRALKEWKSDPSTARPWREVFTEMGVNVSDEKSPLSHASSLEKKSEEDSGKNRYVAQ